MAAETLMDIGRIVFGGFFLIAGIRNVLHFGERRALLTNYGWPLPALLLAIGFAVQLLGGLALVLDLGVLAASVALLVIGVESIGRRFQIRLYSQYARVDCI